MFNLLVAAALLTAPVNGPFRVEVSSVGASSAAPRHYVLLATDATKLLPNSRAPIDAALRAKGWTPAEKGERPDAWVTVGFYSAEVDRGAKTLDRKSYRSWLTLEAVDKAPTSSGPRKLLWFVATSTMSGNDDYRAIYSALVAPITAFLGRSAAPLTTVTVRPTID